MTAQDTPKTSAARAVACWETGEVFPSTAAAAAAIGVKDRSNIYVAIKKRSTAGGYHWYYADMPKPAPEELSNGRKRRVICWETGVEYESATAAAKAVGVPSIGAALRSGSMAGGYHWYYKGDSKPDASTFKGNKPVVCWETNQVFPSTQEAAVWAGTTVSGIYTSLRTKSPSGGYHWYLQGNPRPEEFPPARGGRKARPVVCYETGEVFPSIRQAAEFAGVSGPAAIRWAMGVSKNGQRRSAGGYHWFYADEQRPESLEVEQKAEPESKERAPKEEAREKEPEQAEHPKPEKPELEQPVPKKADASPIEPPATAVNKPARNAMGRGDAHMEMPATGSNRPKAAVSTPVSKDAKPGRRPKPVVCAETGVVYASATEAAAAVGVKCPRNIAIAARTGDKSGGFHWFYQGEDGPKKKQRGPRAVVCWETDEVFPSEEAAAEWAGTTVEAINTVIHTRRCAGGFHWYLASKPKPDASKLSGSRGVVCLETGEVFSGAQAAADAVGVSIHTIYTVLRGANYAAGGYHWYWEGDPKPNPSQLKPWKNHPIMCVESGVVYESVTAAARAVGTEFNSTLSRAARTGGTAAGYHWQYAEEN